MITLPAGLEALFDPDPWKRWEASRPFAPKRAATVLAEIQRALKTGGATELTPVDIDPLTDLPEALRPSVEDWGEQFALYGALNAWLVFVGPSPGNSVPRTAIHRLLGSTPNHRNPSLGRPHPSFFYSNTDGFIVALRTWAHETLTGVGTFTGAQALSSTLALNLTHGQFANAADVSPGGVAAGAERFWTLISPVAHPKLLIALTRNVYRALRTALPTAAIQELPPVPVLMAKRWTQLQCVIRLRGARYPMLLATVPMHPSRVSFLGSDLSGLYAYLGQVARQASRLQ